MLDKNDWVELDDGEELKEGVIVVLFDDGWDNVTEESAKIASCTYGMKYIRTDGEGAKYYRKKTSEQENKKEDKLFIKVPIFEQNSLQQQVRTCFNDICQLLDMMEKRNIRALNQKERELMIDKLRASFCVLNLALTYAEQFTKELEQTHYPPTIGKGFGYGNRKEFWTSDRSTESWEKSKSCRLEWQRACFGIAGSRCAQQDVTTIHLFVLPIHPSKCYSTGRPYKCSCTLASITD